MWWHLGELLKNEELAIPEEAALIEQLTAPMMLQDSSGRLRLEPKDAMKRRGVESPDHADALALPAIRRVGSVRRLGRLRCRAASTR